MSYLKIFAVISTSALLGACATTTPTPTVIPAGAIGTAIANADGTYTILANSTTYTLPVPTVQSGNTLRFGNFLPDARARGFGNADVTAIGGMLSDGTPLAGISGTASASVPTSGSATYGARYTIIYPRTSGAPIIGGLDGGTTVNVDFAAQTVSSSGVYLAIDGNISGVTISGTATCSYASGGCAATVPMEGGFYGTDGIAVVFAGTGLAGAIYGTLNP